MTIKKSTHDSVADNALITLLQEFMSVNSDLTWEGTATELHNALVQILAEHGARPRGKYSALRSVLGFGKKLEQCAPQLQAAGLRMEYWRTSKARRILIQYMPDQATPDSLSENDAAKPDEARPVRGRPRKQIPQRLISESGECPPGTLENILLTVARQVETSLLAAGAAPGTDYTLLDVYRLAEPFALAVFTGKSRLPSQFSRLNSD